MTWFVKFMVSPAGRLARIVAGIALIIGGLFGVAGAAGTYLAAVGLIPLLAGAVDGCLFAPLFGYFLSGSRTRAAM